MTLRPDFDGPPVWRETFRVRAGEMGPGGLLRLPAFGDLLQEASGNHATALRYGTDLLLTEGLTWVLSRLHVSLHRLPAWRDEITVETWPSGVQRLWALRDFRVVDAAGETLAVATSGWLVLKVASKRPIRQSDDMVAFANRTPPRTIADPFDELPGPAPSAAGGPTFRVCRFDLDLNSHANNVSILRWLLEALPEGLVAPLTLEVEYRGECFEGDVLVGRVDTDGPGAFRVALVRQADGREVARARTRRGAA